MRRQLTFLTHKCEFSTFMDALNVGLYCLMTMNHDATIGPCGPRLHVLRVPGVVRRPLAAARTALRLEEIHVVRHWIHGDRLRAAKCRTVATTCSCPLNPGERPSRCPRRHWE